jgi:hypothetical protein
MLGWEWSSKDGVAVDVVCNHDILVATQGPAQEVAHIIQVEVAEWCNRYM